MKGKKWRLSVCIIPAAVRLRKPWESIMPQMCLKAIPPGLTKPTINRDAVRIMKELYGIDMEANGQYSKLISEIPDADIAISMGCNVGCPYIGRGFDDNWGLDDPTGKSDDDFKSVIKSIERNILELRKMLSERS